MTLSPSLRHTIISHTANMNVRERAIRAKELIRRYRIENEEDRREVALIAAIRMEDVK